MYKMREDEVQHIADAAQNLKRSLDDLRDLRDRQFAIQAYKGQKMFPMRWEDYRDLKAEAVGSIVAQADGLLIYIDVYLPKGESSDEA